MPARRLPDKTALITGGASGIGAACAELFAQHGASIAIADTNLDAAHKIVDQINSRTDDTHASAIAIEADITLQDQCRNTAEQTLERFGSIDILINSAGVSARRAESDIDFEQNWDRVIDINLKGSMLMARGVVDHMKQQSRGSIVNIASIRGLVGYPEFITDGFNAYPHSKGGVVQLTRDMAVGLAKSGVRVNAVCPGFTNTDMTRRTRDNTEIYDKIVALHPMGRFAEPLEIAQAAMFLASDEASFVTGACLVIDGGFTAQ